MERTPFMTNIISLSAGQQLIVDGDVVEEFIKILEAQLELARAGRMAALCIVSVDHDMNGQWHEHHVKAQFTLAGIMGKALQELYSDE
jgi:hypothetical protein